MEKLPVKNIIITIVFSYLITSYINAEFNPIKLDPIIRLIQILFTGLSLFIQYTENLIEKK